MQTETDGSTSDADTGKDARALWVSGRRRPPALELVEAQFEDGTICPALWTGLSWYPRRSCDVTSWRLLAGHASAPPAPEPLDAIELARRRHALATPDC